MDVRTHLAIDRSVCGEPIELGDGAATVRLETTASMAVDEQGLVHGGFVFGLADHAAMLAVNDPNVVLGSSSTRFLKPVLVGDEVLAQAKVERVEGRRHVVSVSVSAHGEVVMSGEFVCYVLDQHVTESRRPAVKRGEG